MVAYYYCSVCGNMLETIHNAGNTPICCGKPMTHLQAASKEGSQEKHVPVYEKSENDLIVHVGESPHPMEEGHFIKWVALCTNKGYYRKDLCPQDTPCVIFHLSDDESPLHIYAYCNIHGLWIAE